MRAGFRPAESQHAVADLCKPASATAMLELVAKDGAAASVEWDRSLVQTYER